MNRILILTPADLDLSNDIAAAASLTDPETMLVARSVNLPVAPPVSAQDWALADLAVTAAGQSAQEEGFSAVCLADFGDYGALALRSLLSIPVVSAGRASMHHALTLSGSFAIAATQRDIVRAGKLVHDYGLSAQCSGIFDMTGPDTSLPDHANGPVIVAGVAAPTDGLAQGCLRPLPLIVKLAESLLALGLSHSRRAYPEPEVRKDRLIQTLASMHRPIQL